MTHEQKLALAQKLIDLDQESVNSKAKILEYLIATPPEKYSAETHGMLDMLMGNRRP